jgi:hypothetical protein
MIHSKHLATASSDRIRLPLFFDVTRMQKEVRSLKLPAFLEYDVLPLRAPAHLVDPSIGPPPLTDDYADGSWTQWLDTRALRNSQYLSSVVDTFRANCKVTLVRLLRLAPSSIISEHTDPTLGLEERKSVVRLTIPVLVNDDVQFYLNAKVVPMKPGECWYLRLTDPHRVVNSGKTERVNLTIDLVPNDWLRSLMKTSSIPVL